MQQKQETKLIDGNLLSERFLNELKDEVAKLEIKPHLNIVMVGDNPNSQIYVDLKKEKGEEIGCQVDVHKFEKITSDELRSFVQKLNTDESNGYIIQMPIGKEALVLNEGEEYSEVVNDILDMIDPKKDADGMSTKTLGKLFHNSPSAMISATPLAIMKILEEIYGDLKSVLPGKKIIIINRSNIVGKPLAAALLNNDATVTIAHSKTQNLQEIVKEFDIVISGTAGTGIPQFLKGEMIKDGAVVIDVGINKSAEGVAGDVDNASVIGKASYLTPVPGGVGPVTVAMLFHNLIALTK
jgi:methylenetetrahydrofolate dehydrogenase (NADP+) / methenyltetrahydrofolate cyclohydrolase